MNRIDRLFGILTLLQSRKYVSAEKISDQFDISIRTVYRDIKALGESGIPLCFETGKGYCIVKGYFLPPVSFSTEEANAILLMESLVAGFSDKSIKNHYSNVLLKIKSVLKSSQKDKINTLTNQIRFQLPHRYTFDFEYLTIIQNCITDKLVIEIIYKNNNDEQSCRKIETIGLIFYAFSWHVIAWCYLRLAYRDFKITGIISLKETGEHFLKTDHMQLADYMKLLPVNY